MWTEFFLKKIRTRMLGCMCVFTVLACTGFACFLSSVKTVVYDESVYFLVREDSSVAAGAEFVKWNGGAGYFLEDNGIQYVAYSVFWDKADGELVQKRLEEVGQKSLLLNKGNKVLYFKGDKKKMSDLYVGALKLFKSYISLLEDCIGRLENGMTQEACKRILGIIERQFHYAKEKYIDYKSFSNVCGQSEDALTQLCAQTVYLKDLRFLLCWQSEKYIQLCNSFAL